MSLWLRAPTRRALGTRHLDIPNKIASCVYIYIHKVCEPSLRIREIENKKLLWQVEAKLSTVYWSHQAPPVWVRPNAPRDR